MNKKILAGVLITSLLIGTNSFAANEAKKLDTISDFGLKIDSKLDKNNLNDEIKLQDNITIRFDKDGNLLSLDGLNAKDGVLKGKTDEKFEDYLKETIEHLKKEGHIPDAYKQVDRQDILENGVKIVFEKENSFNVKNPHNIITLSFDKKTNELKTFNKIEDFEVTKAPAIKLEDAKKVALEKLKSIKDFDESKLKSQTAVTDIDKLPTKFTDTKGLVVCHVFEYNGTKVYVDANTNKLLGADKLKIAQSKLFDVSRISGKNRVDTAIQISENYFKSSEYVILANQNNFPDSLSASILSNTYNAPILLTDSKKVDKNLKSEIKRLKAMHFIKIGGKNSISDDVFYRLIPEKSKVKSFKGSDRYATNAEIIREYKDADTCIIANGDNFADSLAIGAFATKHQYPIVLVQKNKINEVTKKALKKMNFKKCYIVGGENSVSRALEKELPKVIARISGKDRYETSLKIAEKFYKDSTEAYLASGEVFADSLAINPIAALNDTPLILTEKDKLPQKAQDYLQNSKITELTIVGGQNTVSKKIQQQLSKKVESEKTNTTFTYTKDGKKITIELSKKEKEQLDELMKKNKDIVKKSRLKSIFDNYFKKLDKNGKETTLVSVNIEKNQVVIDDSVLEKGAVLNKDNTLAKQYIEFIEKLQQK